MDPSDFNIVGSNKNIRKSHKSSLKKVFAILSFIQGENTYAQDLKAHWKIEGIMILYNSIQMISLLIPIQPTLNDWDSYSTFWRALKYIRIDYISFKFGFGIYLIAIISLYDTILIFSIIILWLKYSPSTELELKFSDILIKIPFYVTTTYLDLSLSIISVAYLKYISAGGELVEYGVSIYTMGSYMKFWIILFLMLKFINASVKELFMYECAHKLKTSHPCSKATGIYDYYLLLCRRIQVFLYFFVFDQSTTAYYLIVIILAAILYTQLYKRLPYYNQSFNILMTYAILSNLIGSLAFIIGLHQNNSLIIIMLLMVGLPFIALLCIYSVNRKLEDLQNKQINYTTSNWEYELYMREKFIKSEINSFNITNNESNIVKNKESYIIESYYL